MTATEAFSLCSHSLWPFLKLDETPATMEFKRPSQIGPNSSPSSTLCTTLSQSLDATSSESVLSPSVDFPSQPHCLRCPPPAPAPVNILIQTPRKAQISPTAKCFLLPQPEWSCSDHQNLLIDNTQDSAVCYRHVCTIQYRGLSYKFS